MSDFKFDGECEVCGSEFGFLMRDGSILCTTHGTMPHYRLNEDEVGE